MESVSSVREGAAAFPVLLQFEYSSYASPYSAGLSVDRRELAFGFGHLEVREGVAEAKVEVDFSETGNSAGLVLFGFAAAEQWGRWSIGKTSGVIVWVAPGAIEDLVLTLVGDIFPGVGEELDLTVTTSLGQRAQIRIGKGAQSVQLALGRPEREHPNPFFDHSRSRVDPHNCSLSTRHPVVSIIILNFNRPALAVLSAMSVMASDVGMPYEILIVDNGSDPGAVEQLRDQHLAARIEYLPSNRFFGEGNNLGAEKARGDYLLFVNNDAFVGKGCVAELLKCFSREPRCGAAGPVFYYPNGMLQEAGAFVDAQGMTLQRGKHSAFDVESLLQVNAVDYVSAACLMIRAQTFAAIGGFNYRFDPAYFEDVDLCFRLRALGKTVVLARDAVCMHIENASSAKAGSEFDLHEVSGHNRGVFVSVWDEYLAVRSPASLRNAAAVPLSYADGLRRPPQNGTAFSGPILPSAGLRYAAATTLAMERLGPASLAFPSRCSAHRLRNVLSDLDRWPGDVGAEDIASMSHHMLERSVEVGRGLYPQSALQAKHSCFVNLSPGVPAGLPDSELITGLGRLSACQTVIVPSEFAKKAYERTLASHGASANIQVVYSSAHVPTASSEPTERKPWVLGFDAFDGMVAPGSHEALIEAFRMTSAAFRKDWTLVLCGDAPNNARSRAYLRRLQEMVHADIKVEFVLSPSRARLDRLMAQSAVFASALGVAAADIADTSACDHVGSTMVEALLQGCDLIAYELGVGPELIARAGRGRVFGSLFEFAHLLEVSAVDRPLGSQDIDFGFSPDAMAFGDRFLKAMDA